MTQLLITTSNTEPDNCEYYSLDGDLITEQGYIVADWLSPSIIYLEYPGLSSTESAHVVACAITDFCRWVETPKMRGYNSVAVCHISTTQCLIAPALWCGGNKQLAKYLEIETPEGKYEYIN
jgi:hypothetical protein